MATEHTTEEPAPPAKKPSPTRPAFWLVLAIVGLVAAGGVGLLLRPRGNGEESQSGASALATSTPSPKDAPALLEYLDFQ